MPLQPRALVLISVFAALAGWVAYDATHRNAAGGSDGTAGQVVQAPAPSSEQLPRQETQPPGAPVSSPASAPAPATTTSATSAFGSSASPQRGASGSSASVPPAVSPALPVRPELTALAADPFGARSWQAQTAPAAPAARAQAAAPQPSSAPPLPFRFVGRMYQNGGVQYYVARGNDVFTVDVGDTLAGDYKVQSINDDRMTLVYLPAKKTQTLELDPSVSDDSAVAAIPLPDKGTGRNAAGKTAGNTPGNTGTATGNAVPRRTTAAAAPAPEGRS